MTIVPTVYELLPDGDASFPAKDGDIHDDSRDSSIAFVLITPADLRMAKTLTAAAHLTLICAITLLAVTTFAMIGTDPHHDGIMLQPALDVAHGKILFKDSFTFYNALTTFAQAAALRLFGESLLVLRLETVLPYLASAVFFWLIWAQLLPPSLATLAWLSCLSTLPLQVPTRLQTATQPQTISHAVSACAGRSNYSRNFHPAVPDN